MQSACQRQADVNSHHDRPPPSALLKVSLLTWAALVAACTDEGTRDTPAETATRDAHMGDSEGEPVTWDVRNLSTAENVSFHTFCSTDTSLEY